MSESLTLSRSHSTLSFSVHPLAHAAYQWTLSYPKLIPWKNLPTGLVSQLLRQPLQGVMRYQQQGKTNKKVCPTEFQLYAPLWPALYWEEPYPPEGTLLIHNSATHVPKDEEIEQQAWASALNLLMMSVDSGELAVLREHFQAQLPHHMAQHFFGKERVTDKDLCQWTGCSRATLVQQRQRAAAIVKTTEPSRDPFELLNADWEPNHGK